MHRRFIPFLVLAGLGFVAGRAFAANPVDALVRELRRADGRVLVAAHRADWRNYPENSLEAIDSSIAAGVDMVEIDLARTRDGELVLMHDRTVDRTTTGKGRVADLTLAEIRALRLRKPYGAPTPYRVPTLREALVRIRGRILVNLDKSYDYFAEILPILESTGTTAQVLMKGAEPFGTVSSAHRERLARVAYMPVISMEKPDALQEVSAWVDSHLACAVELVFREWTPAVDQAMDLCRRGGVRIWVNTLWPELDGGLSDEQAEHEPGAVYGRLLAAGVSMIQTDAPKQVQAYLRHCPSTTSR